MKDLVLFKDYIDEIGVESFTYFDGIPQWDSVSFKSRFLERFNYRYCGKMFDLDVQDDVSMFSHYVQMVANELSSLYKSKLTMQISKFNSLYERTIHEERKSEYYINPIGVTNAKLQDYSKDTLEKSFNWLMSNPKLMEEVNKVNVLYEEMLNYCERLFWGEY